MKNFKEEIARDKPFCAELRQELVHDAPVLTQRGHSYSTFPDVVGGVEVRERVHEHRSHREDVVDGGVVDHAR